MNGKKNGENWRFRSFLGVFWRKKMIEITDE